MWENTSFLLKIQEVIPKCQYAKIIYTFLYRTFHYISYVRKKTPKSQTISSIIIINISCKSYPRNPKNPSKDINKGKNNFLFE